MLNRFGLCCIWLVGISDSVLTRIMVEAEGSACEVNGLARCFVDLFGPGSLLPFKVACLGLFTCLVTHMAGRDRRLAIRMVQAGMAISAFLAVWWSFALNLRA